MNGLDGMQSIFAAVAIAAPLTMALVELIKRQGLPDRFAPITALLSGLAMVALMMLADVLTLDWGQVALTGVIAGLTASGVYSGVRAVKTG